MSLQVIILAAGCGKRMFSKTPKVLHKLGGKTLLAHVVATVQQLQPDNIFIVYGYGGEQVKNSLPNFNMHWVLQAQQLGTGHAVMQVLPNLDNNAQVLLLSADLPLVRVETLRHLLTSTAKYLNTDDYLALLLANVENPYGLGRIIRNSKNDIIAIVEEKDATPTQKQISEIYTGICCAKATSLKKWLANITNNNAQQEYYLTDLVSNATHNHAVIIPTFVEDNIEIQGINNRWQLHNLERIWQYRSAQQLLNNGIGIADANRFDLRGDLHCGTDVNIDINVIFNGIVNIGKGCYIGPHCVLTNVVLGENCNVYANSVLDDCVLGNGCQIGPFARLRPGTKLADHCKIGNFVETKNIIMDHSSKANHLTYLGDANIGKNVNIGAGTITCNYDGANKHQTLIGDNVLIGSDTQLIAPITIGANATIGAGSTIRIDAPADQLTVTETKQKTIGGWSRPVKKTQPSAKN